MSICYLYGRRQREEMRCKKLALDNWGWHRHAVTAYSPVNKFGKKSLPNENEITTKMIGS